MNSNLPNSSDNLYPVSEAARFLGIHPSTLRLWESQGLIKPERTPGGDRRYSKGQLEALLQRQMDGRRRENGVNPANGDRPSLPPLSKEPPSPPPPNIPVRSIEHYRTPSRAAKAFSKLLVLGLAAVLFGAIWWRTPDLTKERLKRAFESGPGSPIVDVNDAFMYRTEGGVVRALIPKFPLEAEELTAGFLRVTFDALFNTARFIGTIFFGQGTDYFITPLGDASFRSIASGSGEVTTLRVTDLIVTGTTTGVTGTGGGGPAEGGDADTLEGQPGSYYLAWTNFTGTPVILSSLNSVTNNEGNINLLGSANILVAADDSANTISFSLLQGAGSGLDADTLDTLDSLQFLRSDVSDSFTSGTLTIAAGAGLDVLGTFTCTDCINSDHITDIYLFNNGDTATGSYTFEDDVTLGLTSADTLIVNALVSSDIIPIDNTRDLGSAGLRWDVGYFDEIIVNTLSAGTADVSGTISSDWLINSDNATNDLEDATLTFERGTPVQNGVLRWDRANDRYRFEAFPLYLDSDLFVAGTNINLANSAKTVTLANVANALNFDSNTLSIDALNNRVGIGTVAPSVPLQVAGDAKLSDSQVGGSVDLSVINTDNTNASSNARVYARVGGSSAGDPSFQLTVSGATDWGIGVDNSDSDKLKIGDSFAVGTGTVLTLQTDGSVGIGTTEPDSRLHIVGGDTYFAPDTGYTFNNPSASEDLYVFGNLEVDGTLFSAGQTIGGHLLPAADDTYDLGSASLRWRDLYLGPTSLNISDTTGVGGSGTDYVNAALGFSGEQLVLATSLQGVQATGGNILLQSAFPAGGTTTEAFAFRTTTDLGVNDELFQIGDSGGDFFTVRGSGNVGIGTAAPGAKLDISAGANLNLGVDQLAHDDFTNEGIGITFSRTSSDSDLMAVGVVDTDKLGIFSRQGIIFGVGGDLTYSRASEVMRIANSGNVGIGTASPLDALHIKSIVTTDFRGNLFLSDDTAIAAGVGGQLNFGGRYTGTTLTEWARIRGYKETGVDGEFGGKLAFGTRANGGGSIPEQMTIDASGNVGIGTTSPDRKLDVLDATNPQLRLTQTDGTVYTDIQTNSSGDLFVNPTGPYAIIDGRLRIENPGLLDVDDYAGIGIDPDGNYQLLARSRNVGRTTLGIRGQFDALADIMHWELYNGTVLGVIDEAGNVGIGTADPQTKAHIFSATDDFEALRLEADTTTTHAVKATWGLGALTNDPRFALQIFAPTGAGSEYFRLNFTDTAPTTIADILTASRSGLVGIGIASANKELHVEGEIASVRNNVANLRMVSGTNPSALLRNDGTDFYVLLTDSGDEWGSWNTLRPLRMSLSTGDLFFGNNVLNVIHNGSVGIGDSTPDAKLDIEHSTSTPALQVNQSGTGYLAEFRDGTDPVLYIQDGGTITVGDKPTVSGSSWALSYDGAQEEFFSLGVFNGRLYGGQGNGTGDGDIYVCDPGDTGDADTCDSGDWSLSYDGSQERIRALMAFRGKLYAGQGDGTGDGDILVCNPATTGDAQVCESGDWSTSYDGTQEMFTSLAVYDDKLFAGQGADTGDGDVYVCNPATIGDVDTCDSGDWSVSYNGGQERIQSLGAFDNKLFAGQGIGPGDADVYEFNGTSWTLSFNGSSEILYALAVHNGKLYAAQGLGSGTGTDGDVYAFNGTGWTIYLNGGQERIDALASYNGKLFAGQGHGTGDGDVLFGNGSISFNGSQEIIFDLTVFKGKLYAAQSVGTGDGDIYVYSETRTESYPFHFVIGSGAEQKTGAFWFSDTSAFGNSGSPGADDDGAFMLSHPTITAAGAYDVAEDYPSHDPTIASGDLVAVDPSQPGYIVKATAFRPGNLIGAVSTRPAFRLSQEFDADHYPVALAGRTEVRVTTENGPIRIGDPITVSSLAGVGARAETEGIVVGKALEPYSEEGVGKVMVFVNLGWYDPQIAVESEGELAADGEPVETGTADSGESVFEKITATVLGTFEKLIVRTAEISSAVIENLTAVLVRTEVLEAGEVRVTGSQVGTAVVPQGEDSVFVEYPEISAEFRVLLTPEEPLPVGFEVREGEGFNILIGSPAERDIRVNYWVVE